MEKVNKDWQEDSQEISIVEIIHDYIRHWKWFVLSVILCLVIGVVFVLTTQRQYKSNIAVLLNEDKSKTSGASAGGLSLDELGLLSTTNNIDNEIAILTSHDLMRGVVDSLNLVTSYYTRENFRLKELYDDSPYYVTFTYKKYDFPGVIDFDIIKKEDGFTLQGKYKRLEDREIDINEQIKEFPVSIVFPDSLGTVVITRTDKPIIENQNYNIIITNPILVATDLCSDLTVGQTTKNSSALNLNLTVNNTSKGAAILRELVRQYNVQNVNVNNQIAYNTAIFINERLKEIAVELSDVERDVVDYKQQQKIADLASEAQMSIHQSGQNRERLMDIETQLNVINMVESFVSDPSNELKIIPNLGVSDPALSQIINEYNVKVLNSEALLKNTGEENPMRIRVIDEIKNMRNSITGSLKNVRQAYNISKQDLQRLSGSTMSRIQSIPQQERGLLERVRQQQVKESLFLFLMQKREETNISIASISDKARIIASPQIKLIPIAPKTSIILLAALILGVIIPVVIIYVIGLLKTKISGRSELEKLSQVSVVGQINVSKENEAMVVKSHPNGVTAELFRSLRNNLNFIMKNHSHQLILITSTLSGEGKTFVSVNLALTYALSGKKVLLIGGDVRKPKVKLYLNLKKSSKGLSDYLAEDDNDSDWRDYCVKSDFSTNMDIMISGIIPPNPNELLMSPKLRTLLAETKIEYDIVIVDTAPVGMVSDTYLFDEHVDVTLYVVRESVTPKNAISFINAQKEENRLHNLYLVLNGSSLDKYSGYKYGYAKGYGYGD